MRVRSERATVSASTAVRVGRLAAALAGLALAAVPARAAIRCSITSVSPVAFPAYNVFSARPNDAQGSVTYSCRGVGQDTVTIELSTGESGSFSPRRMRRASEPLAYNLFLDAGRGTIWGDGGGGTGRYGPIQPPNNSPVVVFVFGRIPPAQNVSPGMYADSVILTLNF